MEVGPPLPVPLAPPRNLAGTGGGLFALAFPGGGAHVHNLSSSTPGSPLLDCLSFLSPSSLTSLHCIILDTTSISWLGTAMRLPGIHMVTLRRHGLHDLGAARVCLLPSFPGVAEAGTTRLPGRTRMV